ncbi:hypothetical protein ECA02_00520 [Enterococcus casseliflavus]|nr:hypothetical protein ECA02_00520 [Enterococcus casseliflavus]
MRNSKTIINKIPTIMMTDQPCADQFFYAKKSVRRKSIDFLPTQTIVEAKSGTTRRCSTDRLIKSLLIS